MKIPFISLYSNEKAALVDGIFHDFRKVVESSEFILGTSVKNFENEFARVAGTNFAVGVNSGLDALILSLRLLKVGCGDEVIMPPNSFIATAAAVSLVGAKPVFVDVDHDYNINPELIERAVTARTKAIIPVHLTGNPARMREILSIAKRHGLLLVEDAAQAIGAMENGKMVGSFGDASAFSLHPLKNLHVWGDGGVVTLNSEQLYADALLQRNHGLKNRDEAEYFSFNSRLDSLQAVVGTHFLKLLESTTEKRIHNANMYFSRLHDLGDQITLPPVREGTRHVFHVFQTRVKNRDALKSYLSEHGVETKIHYPLPIHWQKAAQHLGYRPGDFPVTDLMAKEIISLPIRENLKADEIEFVTQLIRKYFSR